MSRTLLIVFVVGGLATAIVGGLLLWAISGPPVEARAIRVLSPVYTVQEEFRSMMGPSSTEELRFPGAQAAPELAWIIGYRATVVGKDGTKPVSQEFMCHANLDFDSKRHAQMHGLPVYHTDRLFTLSQGQQEIRLPEGFGIPFYTDEKLKLTTQVLNLNPDGERHELRHSVAIDYVLDRELVTPLKPLFMTSAWGLKLLDGHDGYFGVETPELEQQGSSCLPGEAAGPDTYTDEFSRRFSGHWVVPPGREVNPTLVTEILEVPYDTTVHYIAAHLHPFAESVELRDLTTGETVYQSKTEGYEDKIGLKRVESFSSSEGIPVYADHEYELVSTYNNTTDRPQDSMAVMLFYLHDKRFKPRPRAFVPLTEVAHVEHPPRVADERLVLHTAYGDVIIGLFADAAPRHTERILELARLGVYDSVYFHRLEPNYIVTTAFPHSRTGAPLTPEQQAAIRPIDAEFTDLPVARGTVLMALHDNEDPDSAQAELMIVLTDHSDLEQRYTVVGKVTKGFPVLQTMAQAKAADPSLNPVIESAKVVTIEELHAEAQRGREGGS